MRKNGNGDVDVCVKNLLSTYKGEVPYARDKGINSQVFDMPHTYIEQEMIATANEVVEKYEKRVIEKQVDIDTVDINGEYHYTVNVRRG